jgi:hypothetical protein
MASALSRGIKELVILSGAKDHLAEIERRKMILRFAQDDKLVDPTRFRR